jgi:DNA-binding response OmpR family regulator
MRALLIDDDVKLSELLSHYFERFNIELIVAHHPTQGLELLRTKNPEIVILDVMLPDQDGFAVCKTIRKESDIPIIMLTARGDTTDKIVGLELGADDYLSKPFEPRELVARMQTITRRQQTKPEKKAMKVGNLEIKVQERSAFLQGKDLQLTSNEFELLHYLASNPGRKIDRDEIMNHLRGIDSDVYSRSIDILVSRLRQKLGEDSKNAKFIKTAWGMGYIFTGEES